GERGVNADHAAVVYARPTSGCSGELAISDRARRVESRVPRSSCHPDEPGTADGLGRSLSIDPGGPGALSDGAAPSVYSLWSTPSTAISCLVGRRPLCFGSV